MDYYLYLFYFDDVSNSSFAKSTVDYLSENYFKNSLQISVYQKPQKVLFKIASEIKDHYYFLFASREYLYTYQFAKRF